jgi:hypothetical protein
MYSLEMKREYIDDKQFDLLARGIFRVLEDMYIDGTMVKKPKNVEIDFRNSDGKDMFILEITTEDDEE